jgi:hypothetical protein
VPNKPYIELPFSISFQSFEFFACKIIDLIGGVIIDRLDFVVGMHIDFTWNMGCFTFVFDEWDILEIRPMSAQHNGLMAELHATIENSCHDIFLKLQPYRIKG